jgi:hypothetical protein
MQLASWFDYRRTLCGNIIGALARLSGILLFLAPLPLPEHIGLVESWSGCGCEWNFESDNLIGHNLLMNRDL